MQLVTSEELDQIKLSGQPVLVDYFATWCGPCKALIPMLERIEPDFPNVKFVKLNVDENRDHSVQMGIRSVPTVIFYNNNDEVSRSSGVNSDSFYKNILKSF
jgi:thioredoxin 1